MKLSVIVPAYNEAHRIRWCVESIDTAIDDLGIDHETIVVDDGSTDGTYEIAQLLSEKFGEDAMRVVRQSPNKGKGQALREGFKSSTGDAILFMDVDMMPMLAMAGSFLQKMGAGADAVVASKRHPDAQIKYPLFRRFASRCFNLLVRAVFSLPLTDTQAGFKLFKRKVLEKVIPKLKIKRFAFDVELMANVSNQGYTIADGPLIYYHREERMGIRHIFRMAIDLLAIFYRLHFTDTYR